eukprot:TRINITY_DN657_c0_g1_i1.p1 TRINITY_DN657_c0_g1~~TRINITY_DN657_c0_g1_i1.p1  ORF type:complete len:388 (-),score=60.38 TRINITY_DN657_c0_g1_i1:111-1274(-)
MKEGRSYLEDLSGSDNVDPEALAILSSSIQSVYGDRVWYKRLEKVAARPPDEEALERMKSTIDRWDCLPIHIKEYKSYFDEEGRVINKPKFQRRLFYGGASPAVRVSAWKFMFGLWPWDSTVKERAELDKTRLMEYTLYKSQWQNVTEAQAKRFKEYRERLNGIDKDVPRTDRHLPIYEADDSIYLKKMHQILMTYTFYNFDLGYVQGMNDLLSVIIALIATNEEFTLGKECEVFWCFAGLMEKVQSNFYLDHRGLFADFQRISDILKIADPVFYKYLEKAGCMGEYLKGKQSLHPMYCLSWVLLCFKRDFEFETVPRLWDALWSGHKGDDFRLYFAAATLLSMRENIVTEKISSDELLMMVNNAAGTLALDTLLVAAERLYNAQHK